MALPHRSADKTPGPGPRVPLTDTIPPSTSAGLPPATTQWRRNQIAITVAAAMIFTGFTLVTPFLPFYLKSIGVRTPAGMAIWAGLLLTITPLLASILGPFWGRLADRVGMKIMVQRVLFTLALHWGLMFFTTDVWHVLILRLFLGLFSGFGMISIALVTQGCPKERIGRAIGLLQATQILSTAVGPFLGGFLAVNIGIRHAYLVTCALCVSALLLVIMLYRDTGEEAPAETPVVITPAGPLSEGVRAVVPRPATASPATRRSLRSILALPGLASLMPLLFLTNMVDRSLFLVVPLFISSPAIGGETAEAATGAIMSAGALAGAASALLLGRGFGRVAPLQILLWSLVCGTLLIVPMGLSRSVLSFAALRVALGLAVGGAATLLYSIAGGVIPDRVRASAYSTLSSVAVMGGALGPSLCGLISAWDVRAPLFAGGLVYLGLALHTLSLARHRRTVPAVSTGHPTGGPS